MANNVVQGNFGIVSPAGSGVASGGGSGDNGDMEHRVTALETRLDTVLPTLATKADILATKTDISDAKSEMIKWVAGVGIAGVSVIISVMSFLILRADRGATPAQTTPIVIQVPPAVSVPAPPTAPPAEPSK